MSRAWALCGVATQILTLFLTLWGVRAARPKSSYLKYDLNTDAAAVHFGSGTGLPKGNLTVSFWLRLDGWHGDGGGVLWSRSNEFDIISLPKFTDQPMYLNFGQGSYYDENVNRTALSVTFASWHQETSLTTGPSTS